MSSISNVVAFDGAATPVSHTLVPISVAREGRTKVVAEWRETGLAVPTIAQPRLRISLEKYKTGVYKADATLVVPVMESVAGQNAAGYTAAPKVAHEMTEHLTSYYHERSDVAGRRLVRQLGLNIFGGVTTSVTPVTTGPVPELFDLLVAPT